MENNIMYDQIFYPDRSATEITRLNQEWAEFIALQRTADPILYPDRAPEEALALCEEGQTFFRICSTA